MYIETRYYDNGKSAAKLHLKPLGCTPEEGSTDKYDFYYEEAKSEDAVKEWLEELGVDLDLYVPFLCGRAIDITPYV